MRLASYSIDRRPGWGAVVEDGIIDLGRRLGHASLRAALAAGALEAARAAVREAAPEFALRDVTLDVPLPDAGKIVCVGRNYKGHVAEANLKLPEFPSVFLRTHDSLVAHEVPVVRPGASSQYDYEGELALIIGTPGRHIARDDALRHVAGYSIFNDGSVRDYQFKHSLIAGKNFCRSGSFGPWLVTADEIPDPSKLTLETKLNGKVVQHAKTDDLIFDVAAIIAYVSAFTPLNAGDVIATGTPEGVGFARTPPLWLQPGDVLEVAISDIGTLRNPVVDEGDFPAR